MSVMCSPSLARWGVIAGFAAISGVPAFAGDIIGDITEPDIIEPTSFSRAANAFYVGTSAGYASGGSDEFGLRTDDDVFAIGDVEISGGYGGLRAGWRGVLPTSFGRDYVYGFELGYDFGTLDDSASTAIGSVLVDASSSVSDVLSIRFRNGLTSRSGRSLYFVSFGYVQGDVTTAATLTEPETPFSSGSVERFEDSDNRDGFVASIGAEHQLSKNWSVVGEIEYVQFESRTVDLGTFSTRSTPKYTGLRLGLNYTF